MLLDHGEPTNYEEAMMSADSEIWLEAMKSEIGSMYENKVWTLVDFPDDRKAIENKWIFKRRKDDDSVTIYKFQLVAEGFRQVQGVDYDETFSLVAMLKVCMNHVSISYIYEIWQIGYQNKFPYQFSYGKVVCDTTRRFLSILKDANKYAKLQQSF